MENNDIRFEIPRFDIDSEKKTIVRKLTNGKYLGEDTKATDYAVLNGVSTYRTRSGVVAGRYWLADTYDVYDCPRDMMGYGPDYQEQKTSSFREDSKAKTVGTRLTIKYSEIQKLSKIIEEIIYPRQFSDDVYYAVEFGEYPQTIVDKELEKKLNLLYENNLLQKTGKFYTKDLGNPEKGMDPLAEDEYEFEGNRYIRTVNLNPEGILSNGTKAGNQEYYWVKVEPVVWVVDKYKNKAYTNKIVIGGVSYNQKETYAYSGTYIESFITKYFTKELLQKNENVKNNTEPKTHKVKVRVRHKN